VSSKQEVEAFTAHAKAVKADAEAKNAFEKAQAEAMANPSETTYEQMKVARNVWIATSNKVIETRETFLYVTSYGHK
jgi:hypothetical protein